jgi:hypothetical protein
MLNKEYEEATTMGHIPCYFFMFCMDSLIYKASNERLPMRDKPTLFPFISGRVKGSNLKGIISAIKTNGFLAYSRH